MSFVQNPSGNKHFQIPEGNKFIPSQKLTILSVYTLHNVKKKTDFLKILTCSRFVLKVTGAYTTQVLFIPITIGGSSLGGVGKRAHLPQGHFHFHAVKY